MYGISRRATYKDIRRQEMAKILQMMIFFVLFVFVAYGCSSMQVQGSPNVMLEQSRSHEDCMELTPTDVLNYSFTSSKPLNFNIHYHEEGNVTYAVSKENTTSESGTFYPEKKQYYCLMWTNSQPETVPLSYTFKVEKKPAKQ